MTRKEEIDGRRHKPVSVSIPLDVLQRIDGARGRLPRSTFIVKLVEDQLDAAHKLQERRGD